MDICARLRLFFLFMVEVLGAKRGVSSALPQDCPSVLKGVRGSGWGWGGGGSNSLQTVA